MLEFGVMKWLDTIVETTILYNACRNDYLWFWLADMLMIL